MDNIGKKLMNIFNVYVLSEKSYKIRLNKRPKQYMDFSY